MHKLHDAIINQNDDLFAEALIEALKFDTLEERNDEGLTALQIASREGAVKELIALIEAGANINLASNDDFVEEMKQNHQSEIFKNPLYLAIENDHKLCAIILRLMKTEFSNGYLQVKPELIEKNKAIDDLSTKPLIFNSLLISSVILNANKIFNACMEKFDEKSISDEMQSIINGLVNVAIANKNQEITKKLFLLLKLNANHKGRGPLYWSAITKNDETTLQLLEEKNVNELQTIAWLKADKQKAAIDFLYPKLDNFNSESFHNIVARNNEEKLTEHQNRIYQNAAKGRFHGNRFFTKDKEADIEKVFSFAYNDRDFIAIQNLLTLQVDYSKVAALAMKVDRLDIIVLLCFTNCSLQNILNAIQENCSLAELDQFISAMGSYSSAMRTAQNAANLSLITSLQKGSQLFTNEELETKAITINNNLQSYRNQKIIKLEKLCEEINTCISAIITEEKKLTWLHKNKGYTGSVIFMLAFMIGMNLWIEQMKSDSKCKNIDTVNGECKTVLTILQIMSSFLSFVPIIYIYPSTVFHEYSELSTRLLSRALRKKIVDLKEKVFIETGFRNENAVDNCCKTISLENCIKQLNALSAALEGEIKNLKLSLPNKYGFFASTEAIDEIKIEEVKEESAGMEITDPLLMRNIR